MWEKGRECERKRGGTEREGGKEQERVRGEKKLEERFR